ncbi:MAG TPA: hypothetical protein VFV92_10310 [Candidatus Bathyarchaeia archaeon]|nr:hypothetical protein [Candidatus Bathyarchaeia archaeon]
MGSKVARKLKESRRQGPVKKPVTPTAAEARRLIAIIVKTQVPFGESAPLFAKIRAQVERGKELSVEDYEHLLGLVKKAREWEKGVESSAMTRPEETLSG